MNSRRFIAYSHPAPHLRNIVIVGRAELAARLGFLEADVDPIDGSEDGERRHEHRPGADPYGNALRECDQAQIHWVTGELVGTAGDKFAIGRRSQVGFGVVAPEQDKSPDRRDEGKHHQSYSQRRKRKPGMVGQPSD